MKSGVLMANADIIMDTLEKVAEKVGDPAPLVYERLFRSRPDLETLFFMDSDAGVRGSMLQQCLECIMDVVGEGTVAQTILPSECQRHVDYDVPDETFWSFFEVIRDTFRESLGDAWSDDMEREWNVLLGELRHSAAVAA